MKSFMSFLNPFFFTVLTLLIFTNNNYGQKPNLRSVANFVLFTSTGALGNTGISDISGNIGTNAGAITGFDDPGTLSGMKYNADPVTAQAKDDLLLAYDQLNNTAQTIFPAHNAVLGGGEVLTPGVYLIASAGSVDGILTLDGEDNPNAVFIFKIQGAFSPGIASQIVLANGALAANVFWKVEGAISVGGLSDLKGTYIANNDAISIMDGSTLEGRALSTTGAVNVASLTAFIPQGTLPVSLIDFKATKLNHTVELTWTTANELSLASYGLERSADGRSFYNIVSLPATNSPNLKTWNWLDNHPLDAVNFYRLKMTDIDLAYKYSTVVRIDMNAEKSISVYPNPVTDHVIMLQMNGQAKGEHIINLYNSNGKQVMSTTITESGNDSIRSIALDRNLPNGVYYLVIHDPEKKKQTLKIIIN